MNFFQFFSGGSSDSTASTAADAVSDEIYNRFLSKLVVESESGGGPFLFSENGNLQEYLREVEDGVLLYLVLSKFNLLRASVVFQEKANALVGEEFGLRLSSLVYANSPVNQIRSSIRIVRNAPLLLPPPSSLTLNCSHATRILCFAVLR